jgi:hypothetical protein
MTAAAWSAHGELCSSAATSSADHVCAGFSQTGCAAQAVAASKKAAVNKFALFVFIFFIPMALPPEPTQSGCFKKSNIWAIPFVLLL